MNMNNPIRYSKALVNGEIFTWGKVTTRTAFNTVSMIAAENVSVFYRRARKVGTVPAASIVSVVEEEG